MFLQVCISSPGGQSCLGRDMLLANSVTNGMWVNQCVTARNVATTLWFTKCHKNDSYYTTLIMHIYSKHPFSQNNMQHHLNRFSAITKMSTSKQVSKFRSSTVVS